MTTQAYPWIRRQAADELYQKILEKPDGVHIYLLEAPAGVGKTYLARDIGVRLGSESGYEPGSKEGVYWSGIVDLYDPEINSKRIEQLWIEAFGTLSRFEFDNYYEMRKEYETSAEEAVLPSALEKLIEKIRTAFALGLKKAIDDESRYPVMVFDTVERLQTILDPAQRAWNLELVEPPDVISWLYHQLTYLPRGVILMMGRPASAFSHELEQQIKNINVQHRQHSGLKPIDFHRWQVEYLAEKEQEIFFSYRIEQEPDLNGLLDTNLRSLLITHTRGNPLLLDIALQTLLETRQPELIQAILKGAKGIKGVEEALLREYMNQGEPARIAILTYLAIARNGLFEGLLRYIDPHNFETLKQTLDKMATLPFLKVRNLSSLMHKQSDNKEYHHAYFLHDEMYEICDRVGLIRIEQVRNESKNIVDWYDIQIKQISDSGIEPRQSEEIVRDLMVASFPYRMRANPTVTYQWLLVEADKAIRGAKRDWDMRLQSAISQFISSASNKEQSEGLPVNPIDREILLTDMPNLYDDFKIDSTLLWIKRFSVRGRHEAAIDMARRATWMEEAYQIIPERYLTTFMEFLLWWGQSLMYVARSEEALDVYNRALDYIQEKTSFNELQNILNNDENEAHEKAKRTCFLIGRFYNNRGYLYWYKGLYFGALVEFNLALQYFELADIQEEIANTSDNRGRVFASLGYSFQAFEEIGKGLKLRIEAKLPYREALSRNSLAIVYARFGYFQKALDEIETASQIFRRIELERGKALADFTRGFVYRRLTREIEPWQNSLLTTEQALKYNVLAETNLRDALRTFSQNVQETIRKIQILNELACCYRVQYVLVSDEQEKKKALERSKEFFAQTIRESEKANYVVNKIDSLQDRAILFSYARQFDNAQKDIANVRKLIPDKYHIRENKGILSFGEDEQCVYIYYKLLGQAETLTAMIVDETNRNNDEILYKVFEHYCLAAAYFNTFSSEGFTQSQLGNRIYARLRGTSPGFIHTIREKHLPAWLEKYNLPPEPIHSQFEGIFSTLLPEIRAGGGG